MAKKKKHGKKKNKHKSNVAKTTTSSSKIVSQPKPAPTKKGQTKQNESAAHVAKQNKTAEIRDVKFSLLLFGIIIVIFGVIFVVIQYTNVAESLYGLINLSQ